MDAGDKAEGYIHLAAPLDEETIREECSGRIETLRRVEWGRRHARIIATIEERYGSLLLSSRPFNPSNEEILPLACEVVRSSPSDTLNFTREVQQLQARVSLMRRTFPEENWPDLSDECLTSRPEDWLLPWLDNIRTKEGLRALDILPGLRNRLSWKEQRRLEKLAAIVGKIPEKKKMPPMPPGGGYGGYGDMY